MNVLIDVSTKSWQDGGSSKAGGKHIKTSCICSTATKGGSKQNAIVRCEVAAIGYRDERAVTGLVSRSASELLVTVTVNALAANIGGEEMWLSEKDKINKDCHFQGKGSLPMCEQFRSLSA